MTKTTNIFAAAVAALSLSAGASYAQDQEGLVNVLVDGNNVQVPIDVAANVCDVSVDVLTSLVGTEDTACEVDSETAAANDFPGYEESPGNGNGQQNGLVNVAVEGNNVQVPIGVAANVCDVDVSVIQEARGTDESVCDIDQETAAANNFPTLRDAQPADTTIDDQG
ncbi:chaplin family protein [Wenxinia marina]|uniref:Small secreted domain protein n=1 Tax=Wenxinia marina DSM 24838 TaxID=1123501 RepID=A0A0D0P8C7_9RHOB|nr:chaplin family protein [Wenxinia marina]KIQ67836.1 Small secreted domain protein [Wenxinia marina DSM 24838]GGL74673.1 hypothetical protein GCM10011392_31620 [Wenxinia marina]